MTTGTSSYKGLAPSLQGENQFRQITAATDFLTMTGATSMSGDFLVMEDVDGTELLWVDYTGAIYVRSSSWTGTAKYTGLDARGTVGATVTSTFYACLGGRLTTSAVTTSGVQEYAIWGQMVHTGSNTGGRTSVLGLYMDITTITGGGGACSWIYFASPGASKPVPYLFSLVGVTADETNGCFVSATNSVIDHAIKIAVQAPGSSPVDYYIGLYDATS